MRTFLTILIALFSLLVSGQVGAREICVDADPNPLAELTAQGCHVEAMANGCKDWFAKNPETLAFAKDCDHPEAQTETPSIFRACAEKFGDSWSSIFTTMSSAAENLDRCDHDPECKSQLAFEAYFTCPGRDGKLQFPCTDAKLLADISAGDLLRKRESLRALANRDAKLRDVLKAHGVQLPQESNRSQSLSPNAVALVLKSELQKLGIKFQCYDSCAITLMMCTAAAEIVDPTMVLGGVAAGIKGGKWAARVLSGVAAEKKVAKASSEGLELAAGANRGPAPRPISFKDQTKMLKDMGVEFGDLRLKENFRSYNPDPNFEVKSGAKVTKKRSPATRALEHPDFEAELERLHGEGYRVAIDTALAKPGSGVLGAHAANTNMIYIRPDTNWGTFMHEVQHQYFARFITNNYADLKLEVHAGRDIRTAMPDEVRAKYTPKQIDELEKFLRADMPIQATNERLSGMQQNELYGFREYLGAGPGYGYTDSFAKAVLHKLKARGPLTNSQQKILNEINARARNSIIAQAAPWAAGTVSALAAARPAIHYYLKPSTGELLMRDQSDDSYIYVTPGNRFDRTFDPKDD